MSEDELAKLLLYLTNFLFPVLLIPLSIPMMKGKVRPNYLYGFRTKKTLASEEAWYAANRFAGRELLVAGLVELAGLLVLLAFYGVLAVWPFLIASWVVTLVPLGVAFVRSLRFHRSL